MLDSYRVATGRYMSIRPAWLWWKRRQRIMKNSWLLWNTGGAFSSGQAYRDFVMLSQHWVSWAVEDFWTLSAPSATGALRSITDNLPVIDWKCLVPRILFSLSLSNLMSVEICWAPGAPWGAITTASSDSRQAVVPPSERRLCRKQICRQIHQLTVTSQGPGTQGDIKFVMQIDGFNSSWNIAGFEWVIPWPRSRVLFITPS